MLKKMLVSLIAGVFLLGVGVFAYAQTQGADIKATASETVNAEEAGNKICPVSGDKINEETKAIYEYEGKIYNFCCPACIEEFKNNPQKYIKKVEEQMQAESEKKMHDMKMIQGIKERSAESEKTDTTSEHKAHH